MKLVRVHKDELEEFIREYKNRFHLVTEDGEIEELPNNLFWQNTQENPFRTTEYKQPKPIIHCVFCKKKPKKSKTQLMTESLIEQIEAMHDNVSYIPFLVV